MSLSVQDFFCREDLNNRNVQFISMRKGSPWRPEVSVVSIGNRKWTVKDYSCCNWFVKNTYARFLLNRELKVIALLHDVDGTPKNPFMVDNNCLAFEFIEGKKLADCSKEEITKEFLIDCEKILNKVHKRGLVHLDTGAMGNWIVQPDNTPALIDFQTAMGTEFMPGPLKRLLRAIDMRGVYKKWMVFRPEEMGKHRLQAAEETEKVRRIWVFHPLKKKKTKN